MIVPGIFVVLAFLALLLLLRLAKGNRSSVTDPTQLAQELRRVDVDAFRNLVDSNEEEFLRSRLTPSEYRSLHRERLRVAIEYISSVARNATILMSMGESARRSPDATIAAAGQRLVDNALRLRLYSLRAMPKLYLGILLPGVRMSPADVADRYERVTGLVVLLGRLQYPARGAGLSAVL
jgi:hypothetical protein